MSKFDFFIIVIGSISMKHYSMYISSLMYRRDWDNFLVKLTIKVQSVFKMHTYIEHFVSYTVRGGQTNIHITLSFNVYFRAKNEPKELSHITCK